MQAAPSEPRQIEQLERQLAAAVRGELARAAAILARLERSERAAFLLSESSGLSPRGVAAVLGVRARTARRLIAAAEERVMLDAEVIGDAWRCPGSALLPGYVSGRLSPAGRLVARSHVRHCPLCRSALASFGDVQSAARTLVVERRDRVMLAPPDLRPRAT